MDYHNSIRDWMSSHDSHSQGIRYEGIDLEDEEAYPLEGRMDAKSAYRPDDMIDDARDLADIFVGYLSESEACACAMIFGKRHNQAKNNGNRSLLTNDEADSIKCRLSKLFDEFVLDYPELSVPGMLKTLFSENVLERCEKIYRAAFRGRNRQG